MLYGPELLSECVTIRKQSDIQGCHGVLCLVHGG